MKSMIMCLLLGTYALAAQADPNCRTCGEFKQISLRIENNAPEAFWAGVRRLGPIAIGREKIKSAAEADAVVGLLGVMLKADKAQNGGDAAQQLFNLWNRNTTLMNAAIAKLSTEDQRFFRAERARGQRLYGEGNG